jgi:branched-chain amino acid transport system ATP-binding protein
MTLLSVEGLETYYGDSQVLFGISLSVQKGEVVALLGRNGAGKTTTLSSIMNLVPARKGEVIFKGQSIARIEPFQTCRAGLGYVPEDSRLFTSLTVAENLETARLQARQGSSTWDQARVLELFPDIRNFLDRKAGALSGGQQRMVAIARTLMGNPDLILLDEPSEGLAPKVIESMLQQLKLLKSSGQTVLISEQNLRFANELADRVYIIEKGQIPYQGTPAELNNLPEVRQQYLMV